MSMRYPDGLAVGMAAAEADTGPLWLPPRLRRHERSDKTELVAVGFNVNKLVYFKGRLFCRDRSLAPYDLDTRWVGGIRRVPYNLDLDEPGGDGLTLRYHFKLYLVGHLERLSGGRWVYQESDEIDDQSVYEEVSEKAHSAARWNAFLRRES